MMLVRMFRRLQRDGKPATVTWPPRPHPVNPSGFQFETDAETAKVFDSVIAHARAVREAEGGGK